MNTCNTMYVIYSTDRKELEELALIFKETMGNNSIGDLDVLLEKLGAESIDDNVYRSEIDYWKFEDDCLEFDVMTPYNRIDDIESLLLEKFPNMSVFFNSEEFGCGVFESNDWSNDIFPEKYYVSTENYDDYLCTDKELIMSVNDYYGKEVCNDVESALKYAEEHSNDEEGYFTIYVKEYV